MHFRRRRVAAGLILLALVAAGALAFHPSRPLYMRHRRVEFVSRDGIVLRGTVSFPRWRGHLRPAATLVHGSGRLAREHLRGDVRRLVREGFAVLAYDKRGVAQSGGVYLGTWGNDPERFLRILAADAAAAFEELTRQPEVDRERVGFFGGSQAGWIIPLAAQQLRPPPRFQIILSGAAVSTGVEGYYSALTGDGNRPPQVRDRAEVERRVRAFDGPAGFDPAPLLAASTVPTLWILGDEDESVPTFASLEALDAIRRGGNRSHTVIHYPGVDHELRDRDGRPAPVGRDSIAWLRSIGILNGREKAAGRPARENADRHEKGRQNRSGVPGGAIGVGS